MEKITEFLIRNIAEVYFFYGLSFFSMGLAILLESGHASELDFGKALKPLGAFGLIHGGHEWFEMLLIYRSDICNEATYALVCWTRIALLVVSFLLLVNFGARLLAGPSKPRLTLLMMGCVTALWLAGILTFLHQQGTIQERLQAIDSYTRYSLAIPGAALTAWGLILQRRKFIQAGMQSFGLDVVLAALAFGLYGGIGQLFTSPSSFPPSSVLNYSTFIRWFGFPVQLFRAVMACFAAIFIIRSLRAFQVENQRRMEALRDAHLAERQRLEAIRAELLHRTVQAQETERQRIARELHDETGQRLTALALGLRGLSENISTQPEKAAAQARHLESLALSGIDELKRLVSGLHPPQLDDLGLAATLRWYVHEVADHYGLTVNCNCKAEKNELPPEVRIVLFRIAQEALTNIVRHAQATQIWVELEINDEKARLMIRDNGRGFEAEQLIHQAAPQNHWGLMGMIERASLVGGQCQIQSQPGQGTTVETVIDLRGQKENGEDQITVSG